MISRGELQEFAKKRAEQFTGSRSRSFANSQQITSSAIASRIGSFAPTVSIDEKNLEFQKKQVELQTAMRDELKKVNKKRGRSFKR